MNALTAFVRGIASAILDWWQGQADKPNVIVKAETPPEKLEKFQDDIEAMKKRKDAEEAAKEKK